MKQTRTLFLNDSQGFLNFKIEAGLYNVMLENYSFRLIEPPQIHRLHIDGLDLGSANDPILINHSGYSQIDAKYITTYISPRCEYRILDVNNNLVDFTTSGQELTLIFQLEKV